MSTRKSLHHIITALSALADATDLVIEWVVAGEDLTQGLKDSVLRRARSSMRSARRELHDAAAAIEDVQDEPHDRESGGALARLWQWLFGR